MCLHLPCPTLGVLLIWRLAWGSFQAAMVSPLSGALGHTSSSGGNTSQFGQASSSMVYRVSSDGAAQFCREADSSPRTPRMMGAGR